MIVAEIGAAEIAALGRREGWFNAPILAVQTDFHTEFPWVRPEIDAYCVASEEARRQLIGWGVLPHRVLLCDIPVHPAFALPFDKGNLKKALGLDARQTVVLLMGGGMGPVRLDSLISSLELCDAPLQVLAVAGHDRRLHHGMERLRGRVAIDLHLFGWTETVPELMAVSDLLITKPGGLTAAEALTPGLPMILTHPIPGPEERHICYLGQKGVALHAETLNDIPRLTSRLVSSPHELREIGRRARACSRPHVARTIAQVAVAMLEEAAIIDLSPTPS